MSILVLHDEKIKDLALVSSVHPNDSNQDGFVKEEPAEEEEEEEEDEEEE